MSAQAMSRWEPRSAVLGRANAMLIARSSRHDVREFPGPVSIKTVLEGRVAWKIQRREVWVDPSSFLVLNDGEPYSMHIETLRPVHTFAVFFERGFVERVVSDTTSDTAHSLDDPDRTGAELRIASHLYPRSEALVQKMAQLRDRAFSGDVLAAEECYVNLASELSYQFEECRKQIARVPAARASTREELFKRASRGREFLHAEACGRITLAAAARASGMSPFHFQRTFKQAFRVSPAKYVSELRFDKAVALLKSGIPVTDACFAVGYDSVGSFSTAFRKRYGVAPSAVRH